MIGNVNVPFLFLKSCRSKVNGHGEPLITRRSLAQALPRYLKDNDELVIFLVGFRCLKLSLPEFDLQLDYDSRIMPGNRLTASLIKKTRARSISPRPGNEITSEMS